MIHTSRAGGRRRGTASLEFAVMLPFLLLLMAGMWEVGKMVEVKQLLVNAAREGGREAVAGKLTSTPATPPWTSGQAQVQRVVLNYLNNAGLQVTDSSDNPLSGVVVTVTDVPSGLDTSQANQLDYITISVDVPYTLVLSDGINLFVSPTTKMNGTAGWYSVKNTPLSVNQTIPSQPQ